MSLPVDFESMPPRAASADRRRAVDDIGRHAAWQREMERAQLASWFAGNPADSGRANVSASHVDTQPSPPPRVDQALPAVASVATRTGMGRENDPAGAEIAYPAAAAMQAGADGGWGAGGQTTGVSDCVHGEASTGEPLPVRAAETRGVVIPPAGTVAAAGGRSTEAGRADGITVPIPIVAPQAAVLSYARNRLQAAGEFPEASSAPETAWTFGAERDRLRFHAQWTDDGVIVWLGLEGDPEATGDRLAGLVAGLRQVLDEQGLRLRRVICNGSIVYAGDAAGAMPVAHGSGVDDARRFISRFNTAFKTQEEQWQSVR